MYELFFSRLALKQTNKIKRAKLDAKVNELLAIIEKAPFQTPPTFEKLQRDLEGAYSRRINIQHRLIYTVDKKNKKVRIVSMWSHYEE